MEHLIFWMCTSHYKPVTDLEEVYIGNPLYPPLQTYLWLDLGKPTFWAYQSVWCNHSYLLGERSFYSETSQQEGLIVALSNCAKKPWLKNIVKIFSWVLSKVCLCRPKGRFSKIRSHLYCAFSLLDWYYNGILVLDFWNDDTDCITLADDFHWRTR